MDNTGKKKLTLRLLTTLALLVALSGCVLPHSTGQGHALQEEPVIIRSVVGDYDQVWDDLTMALNDRGLVVSSVSHVGEMLERTGKALKRDKKIFIHANVMEFCSAVLSRQMMEKNPHYIAFCPFQIMVYSLPENPSKVYLVYRRLRWRDAHAQDVLEAVEKLLNDLIDEVVEAQKLYQ